jgi:hypothetical protein
LREETEIEVEDPARDMASPSWARPLSFPASGSAFRILKGALVAEGNGPVRWAAPYAVITADSGGFFLMIAESKDPFIRVDVTKGRLRCATMEGVCHTVPAGQALCAGPGGRSVGMPSDGREFAPGFGGVLFREAAARYAGAVGDVTLGSFKGGPVLLEMNAEAMAGAGPPEGGRLTVVDHRDAAGKVMQFENRDSTVRRYLITFPMALPPESFIMDCELAWAAAFARDTSIGQELPGYLAPPSASSVPMGPAPSETTSLGEWKSIRRAIFRIGRLPSGLPLYEARIIGSSQLGPAEWMAFPGLQPSALIVAKAAVVQVRKLAIQELCWTREKGVR